MFLYAQFSRNPTESMMVCRCVLCRRHRLPTSWLLLPRYDLRFHVQLSYVSDVLLLTLLLQPLVKQYKSKKPTVVVVTGAAGNIAYSIIFMIGSGA